MSYANSAALQAAVFQHLVADSNLTGLVGTGVYDVVPSGQLPDTYVTLGPEDVKDRSDVTGGGSEHRFAVSIVTSSAGFQFAKDVAAAVADALDNSAPALARGRLVSIRFLRAKARRVRNAEIRRIDLTFRARVEDE